MRALQDVTNCFNMCHNASVLSKVALETDSCKPVDCRHHLKAFCDLGTHVPSFDCPDIHLQVWQASCLAQDVSAFAGRKVCQGLHWREVWHLHMSYTRLSDCVQLALKAPRSILLPRWHYSMSAATAQCLTQLYAA